MLDLPPPEPAKLKENARNGVRADGCGSRRLAKGAFPTASLGISGVRTPPRAPNANAVAERIVRTIRTECLDHLIVIDEGHLRAVLAEFGDDRTRYAHAKARKNYAGTAPITKASGTKKMVLARVARNRRLADACYLWAYASLARSSGGRRYYDALRGRGKSHPQALRSLANRLVGILHGCLFHGQPYSEHVAWPVHSNLAA